jgi:subtilisin family serine protease
MKRTLSLAMCLLAVLLMLAANGTNQPRVSAAPPLQVTETPDPNVEVDAGDPTPEATIPTAGSGKPGGTIKGTPVPTNPLLKPPKTLDELRVAYPDLGPFIDKYKDATVADIPMAELYMRIVEIYEADGATGVATFLEESGMLDKLNIPLSYLDLLRAFDTGGLEAVQALAKKRQLINKNEELVGYLALDLLDNAQTETDRLIALGVSVYRVIEESEEIEIGIPLAVLAQLQTPGKLLEYLIQVANGPHIQGYRLPNPGFVSGLKLQETKGVGAQTIGADKWHEAGITGEGVKVGILDPGFGGFASLLGSELPENVTTIRDADEMDASEGVHGTAVAAVVHKMAPGAELFFADYDPSSFDTFIDALDWLKSQEVKVINFSVTYPFGPRDGTFADAVIVDKYVADTGVVWVNSAGNYALSHTMVKYKAGEKNLHDFGAEEPVYTMPFVAGAPVTTIIMNWNGSWKGSEKSQYDFIILDEEGNELATGNQPKRGKKNDYPVQIQSFESEPGTVYYMAIRRTKGKTDNVLDIFVRDAILADWAQVPGYSVTMPGDANSVLTVGATGLTEDQLEVYSSQGPTLDDRIKPDITAPTGEVLSFREDGFFGTSGSAPMVAGAAALVLQAFPDLTEAEVRAWLAEHIVDLGDNGADPQFGSGRLALPEPSGENGETEGENSGEAELIVISDVKVKFNVKVGKDKGVQIKTSFELDNFEGKQLVVAAIILDANGKAVPSANKKFDVNGTIGTGVVVKPKRNQTVFKNVTLFIPNSAFSKVKNKELFLVVGAIDASEQDNAKLIARSEPVKIRVK